MKEALRGVLEEMAQQEEAVQADLEQKAGVILAQQKHIAVLDAAVQVDFDPLSHSDWSTAVRC